MVVIGCHRMCRRASQTPGRDGILDDGADQLPSTTGDVMCPDHSARRARPRIKGLRQPRSVGHNTDGRRHSLSWIELLRPFPRLSIQERTLFYSIGNDLKKLVCIFLAQLVVWSNDEDDLSRLDLLVVRIALFERVEGQRDVRTDLCLDACMVR